MSKDCCEVEVDANSDQSWKRLLWIALILNFAMFFVEIFASYTSGSMSLRADSLDFLGDSFNYGISLYVAGKSLKSRASVSALKSLTMIGFGIFVLVSTIQKIGFGVAPEAPAMGVIGALAFAVNLSVALMLVRHKDGDSNKQSVWLCTRNDAIGNVLVLIGALFVHLLQSGWPDWIVGLALSGLGVQSGIKVLKLARKELASPNTFTH